MEANTVNRPDCSYIVCIISYQSSSTDYHLDDIYCKWLRKGWIILRTVLICESAKMVHSYTVQLRWFFTGPPKPVGHKIEWGGLKLNDHRWFPPVPVDPPRSHYQKYLWSRWETGEIFASQVIPSQWNRGGSAVGMKACQKGAELNFNPSHS